MPAGSQHSLDMLAADDETWATYVIGIAAERGHTVAFDGVSQLRWTCTRTSCGRAALSVGANIYGSAVEQDCTP